MATASFKGGVLIPAPMCIAENALISFSDIGMLSNGDKVAFIVQAPTTGTITKIGWRTGNVTTGATVDVRLETVSAANGDPTGTLVGTNTNGSQVVGSGDDNTWFLTALTAGASVTKGDIIAVVVVNAAPGAMGLSSIDSVDIAAHFPYSDSFSLGSWTKSTKTPIVALEYSGTSYEPIWGTYPISAITTPSFNTGTSPDEYGLKFKLPFDARVIGAWTIMDILSDFTVKLYDSDGSSVLQSIAIDKDQGNNLGTPDYVVRKYIFSGSSTLTRDTFYRLTVLPSNGTGVSLSYVDTNTANLMDGLDFGQNMHHTSRADAGSWTDLTTRRALLGLIVDQIDSGDTIINHVVHYSKKVR